jgi:hypothetical protein
MMQASEDRTGHHTDVLREPMLTNTMEISVYIALELV